MAEVYEVATFYAPLLTWWKKGENTTARASPYGSAIRYHANSPGAQALKAALEDWLEMASSR